MYHHSLDGSKTELYVPVVTTEVSLTYYSNINAFVWPFIFTYQVNIQIRCIIQHLQEFPLICQCEWCWTGLSISIIYLCSSNLSKCLFKERTSHWRWNANDMVIVVALGKFDTLFSVMMSKHGRFGERFVC